MCTANVMQRKLVDYSRPPLESLRRNDPARRPALRISVGRTNPFPAEKLAKIFLPFEQTEDSATRVHDGTGLGLSIFQAAGGTHARADLGRELGRVGSSFCFTAKFDSTA
jgi:signal transduction histidine kinase